MEPVEPPLTAHSWLDQVGATGSAAGLSTTRVAQANPRSVALLGPEGALSWGDLASEVVAWAQRPCLVEGVVRCGLEEIVVLRAGSGRGTVLSVLAALECGVPLALAPAGWHRAEIAAAFGPLEPTTVTFANSGAGAGPESIALAVATSGSTGRPKVALLSRRALFAAASAGCGPVAFGPQGRWWLSLPLSGIGGLSVLTRALVAQAGVVVESLESFEATAVVDLLARNEVTHTSFVPTQLSRLVAAQLRAPAPLAAALVGGAATTRVLLEQAWELGWPALPTWGASETSAQAATLPLVWWHTLDRRWLLERGCGPALPGVELKVEDGRIVVGGPTLFSGYLGEGRRGADEGFATNDLGSIDEHGCLHVIGRQDDVIICGGTKVMPAEVEGVLARAAGVTEVVVVGLPDTEWGQVVAAVVSGATSAEHVSVWARDHLAPAKRPRFLLVQADLPRLPSGKVDRATAVALLQVARRR